MILNCYKHLQKLEQILTFRVIQFILLKISTFAHINLGTPGIDGTTGWTPLMQAAATGKVEIVRFLKNQGVDLDKADTNGDTALDLAEQNFNGEIVKILREK